MYTTIHWTIEDSVGRLVLTNPPSNKMGILFFDELSDFTHKLDTKSISAIVISGKGRHFSYGAELHELLNLMQSNARDNPDRNHYSPFFSENISSFNFFYKLQIPVIAAIRGVCLGSALEMAMHCHFRFCGENSVLGLPEASYNLIPGCGGIYNLLNLTSRLTALELLLHGNTFSAQQALQWNIADAVMPSKTIIDKAINFARKIATGYSIYYKKDYLKLLQ
ncbi:MAG: enoyl-CoA hydratase/isomerase family protein [Lentimicrobiaceae bacterium]|nr:enoyl-CoA hydratase/isomerase family protein [Lentimicrobiaceae bacterium]